jgi:rfaE bifunctional protein nucleotidyltransferase chain/domain
MNFKKFEREREGCTVVFTNGVFDILHAGHVQYLEQARSLGHLLVVALNEDASVAALKGPTRPINPLADRMRVIGALRCVDYVTSFSENTPENIISLIRPEIHVKGGDYKLEDLPETRIVESYGGNVIILPFLAGRSSTRIIERMESD